MEHIVQFAISMDDEAIKNRVAQNAEKVIIKDLEQMVCNIMFEPGWYGKNATPRDRVSDWTKQVFEEFLDANKEHIVAEAAKLLSERMAKTKAVKDAVNSVVDGMRGE